MFTPKKTRDLLLKFWLLSGLALVPGCGSQSDPSQQEPDPGLVPTAASCDYCGYEKFNGAAGGQLGSSVAASGDWLVAGDPRVKAVYFYRLESGSWTLKKTATSASSLNYGRAVQISGDWAAIGAQNSAGTQGFVDIYHWNGSNWLLDQTLSDANGASTFGNALALSGQWLAVGDELFDSANSINSGRVQIYRYQSSDWTFIDQFASSTNNDGMGKTLAMSGNTLLIGYGAAGRFVFSMEYDTGSGWTPGNFSYQCNSNICPLAMDGDRALVGAPYDAYTGDFTGAVEYFERAGGTWTNKQTLLGSGLTSTSFFGRSVSIQGDFAVAGAPSKDVDLTSVGEAYLFAFESDAWTEKTRIVPEGLNARAQFGFASAISDVGLILGAPYMFVPSPHTEIPAIQLYSR
jgi:hypothetical protein